MYMYKTFLPLNLTFFPKNFLRHIFYYFFFPILILFLSFLQRHYFSLYSAVRKTRFLERLVLEQSHNLEYTKKSTHGQCNGNSSSTSSSSSGSGGNNNRSNYHENVNEIEKKSFIDEYNQIENINQTKNNNNGIYSSIYNNNNSDLNNNDKNNKDNSIFLSYLSVAVLPSKTPPRSFCSVCGYIGTYACTRCGSRYCCSKCLANHKETRCLKFAY